MSNREVIEWLRKKAETTPMPGARKMYEAAARALEAQKDMISRKTANVAICNACGKIDCDKMDKCEKLQLPPANCSEFPNNSDTISRQAAIDCVMECYDNDELFEVYEDRLNELPPIQPEIIRCKDCKHWMPYDWMFSEVWQSKNMTDYPEDEIGCDCCDMAMKANDFCSLAERREVTT